MLDNIVIRLNEGKLLYSVDGNNTLYTKCMFWKMFSREYCILGIHQIVEKMLCVCLCVYLQRCLTFCLGKSGIPAKFSSNYTCV